MRARSVPVTTLTRALFRREREQRHLPTRRRFLNAVALMIGSAATGMLGAACGADSPRPRPTRVPATPIPTPVTTATAPARAPGMPRPGGAVAWAVDAVPTSADPHRSTSDAGLQVWGDLTYQSLTMFDEKLIVVPALAESWTNPDPTTWIFSLRRGVRFHDGHELVADDVLFWHDRLNAPTTAAPDRRWFEVIERVEATGTHTVKMTLGAPHAPLLVLLAGLRGSAIVSHRAAAQVDLARQAVGSGPFRIAELVPGRHVRYVKHADYWERGLPYPDELTIRIRADGDDRRAELREGRLQGALVGPAEARQLAREPGAWILRAPGSSQALHHLNCARQPFDDVRVRRAVALAVDRPGAIERVLEGEGRLTGPIPAGHGAWGLPDDRLPRRRDVARARQLLGEAGLDGGLRTVVKTSAEPSKLRTSMLLAEQLRAIGVEADVQQLEPEALARDMHARDFDVIADSGGFAPDPDGYLTPRYHSGGIWNFGRWSNGDFDELVDRARYIVEPPERKRLYDEAQTILLDEAPSIWWFAENRLVALDARLRGYVPSITGRHPALKTTWWER